MTRQQAMEWWAGVPGLVKQVGAFLTGIGGATVVIGATLNIPARITALEEWQVEYEEWRVEQTRATAYTVCVLGSQTRGIDPAACESHLGSQIFDYLRPRP